LPSCSQGSARADRAHHLKVARRTHTCRFCVKFFLAVSRACQGWLGCLPSCCRGLVNARRSGCEYRVQGLRYALVGMIPSRANLMFGLWRSIQRECRHPEVAPNRLGGTRVSNRRQRLGSNGCPDRTDSQLTAAEGFIVVCLPLFLDPRLLIPETKASNSFDVAPARAATLIPITAAANAAAHVPASPS